MQARFRVTDRTYTIYRRGTRPTMDWKGRIWLESFSGSSGQKIEVEGEQVDVIAVVKLYARPTRAQAVRIAHRMSKRKRRVT